MTLTDFLSRLEGVKGGGNQRSACCPAHDDKHRSLSVSSGAEGQILVKCHAGCTLNQIVSAMALTEKDLFTDKQAEPTIQEIWKEVDTYPYVDLNGKYAEKIRKESNTGKKTFLWRQPNGQGGWIYNRQGVGHVLYNIAAIMDDDHVFVVEGEKDVNALAKHGVTAVCGADGAGPGKWKPEYTEQLRGKHVVIIPDNDAVGKAFAIETADALCGTAASVRVLDLTTIWPELPEHGDVSDLIARDGEQAVTDVRELANTTPLYAGGLVMHEAHAQPPQPSQPPANHALVSLDQVMPEPPRYFWEPYIRLHAINVIRADGGVGKTMLSYGIAAAVTKGVMPDGMPGVLHAGQGSVIYYGAEDEPGEYADRAIRCGCDRRFIHVIGIGSTLPRLTDVDIIREHVRQTDAKLVVFDPVQSFLDGDMNKANEVRPQLDTLTALCREQEITCIIIEHLNKATQQKAHYRGIGSVDFINASRSCLMLGWHPTQHGLNVAVHIKANAKYGEPVAYSIDDAGRFEWRGICNATEDEVANARRYKTSEIENVVDPVLALVLALMEKYPDGWAGTATQMIAEGSSLVDCSLLTRPESIGKKLLGIHHELVKRGISWTKIKREHCFSRRAQQTLIKPDNEDG